MPDAFLIGITCDTAAALSDAIIAFGNTAKLLIVPVPLLVRRRYDALVQVPPDAKSESSCSAAMVPPGFVEEPPSVTRSALPAPEIVPLPLIEREICAPLTVPPVAAFAPVT